MLYTCTTGSFVSRLWNVGKHRSRRKCEGRCELFYLAAFLLGTESCRLALPDAAHM